MASEAIRANCAMDDLDETTTVVSRSAALGPVVMENHLPHVRRNSAQIDYDETLVSIE